MIPPEHGSALIVGDGLAGALMGVYLARAGYDVSIHERRPDPRAGGAAGGRSINLAISTRGIDALAGVGLAETVLRQAIPMRGRMIHARDGSLKFQPYGVRDGDVINSVSRAGLNLTLIEAAAACPNVRLFFDRRCVGADADDGRAHFQDERTGEPHAAEADFVIGADGAFSAVRQSMQRLDRFEYSQSYLAHGYKELSIPPGPDGRHRMEPNALHIWPRRSFMMIALPNIDGSFTCTLFWPFDGPVTCGAGFQPVNPPTFATVRTPAEVRGVFEAEFPDAVPLMPTLAEDFANNPTSSLATVRCGPWHRGGRALLIGDAAHAIVPFYGQGANAAFEDCRVLADCLAEKPRDRAAAFRRFFELRKEQTDVLADLAIANFVEMRDKTGSRVFLMRKKLEKALHRLMPRWYVPLYSMVSFSRTPYADAVRRARRQDRIVAWAGVGIALVILLAAVASLAE